MGSANAWSCSIAVALFTVMVGATSAAPASRSSSSSSAQCLDESGSPVDWWFTYKLPNGYQYAYIDKNTGRRTGPLEISGELSGSSSALIRTLQNLLGKDYNNGTDGASPTSAVPFLLYNDQPDNANPSEDYGHTKGVVAMSDSSAMWLLHSTPNFPTSDMNFVFPSTETDYGQTYLCITVSTSNVDDIAGQLLYTTPYVYLSTIPDSVISDRPALADVLAKKWIRDPGTNTRSFSVGWSRFTSYAKNGEWGKDIYEDLIAPGLGSDLVVETWMRGQQLGSYCKPKYDYQVVDVTNMVASKSGGGTSEWLETQDHAKWCLADGTTQCICDINRMTSQRSRGGGCICFSDSQTHAQLSASIQQHNDCKSEEAVAEM